MNIYYLSLCRGLVGYYVKFQAESEDVVREHAAMYFGRMWCTIYTEAYFREVLCRRYPKASRVVNRNNPIVLTGDNAEWE